MTALSAQCYVTHCAVENLSALINKLRHCMEFRYLVFRYLFQFSVEINMRCQHASVGSWGEGIFFDRNF